MTLKKSFKEDWPLALLYTIGLVILLIGPFEFIFIQNPDLGMNVFSIPGLILLTIRLVIQTFTPIGFLGSITFVMGSIGLLKVRLELRNAGINITNTTRLIITKDHKLLTTGSFEKIRHPIYLAICFKLIGFPILCMSPIGLILTVLIVIPLLLTRIKIEERMLEDEFGESYKEYKKNTGSLIPKLRKKHI